MPPGAFAQIERARALQELGRYQEALDVLASALQVEPSNPTVHSLRAISLAGVQDFPEAVRSADRALQLAPSDPFGHFALAKVLLLKGDSREARRRIRVALEIESNIADYHGLLSLTYQFEQRWTRALEAVDRGLHLDPENGTCLFAKASALSFKGRRSEALHLVERLLHIDPHHAFGLALYESLQRETGRSDSARLSLQANPTRNYVKDQAANDILLGSVVFRWLSTVERIGVRVGPPGLFLITIADGILLWLLSFRGLASGDLLLHSIY